MECKKVLLQKKNKKKEVIAKKYCKNMEKFMRRFEIRYYLGEINKRLKNLVFKTNRENTK